MPKLLVTYGIELKALDFEPWDVYQHLQFITPLCLKEVPP